MSKSNLIDVFVSILLHLCDFAKSIDDNINKICRIEFIVVIVRIAIHFVAFAHSLKKRRNYFCFRVCTLIEKTNSKNLCYNYMIVQSEYIITYELKRFVKNLLCKRINETKNKTIHSTICFNVVLFLYLVVYCNLFVFVRNLLHTTFIWSK